MTDGPTSVDEYLAMGGTITRERPSKLVIDGEFEWEQVGSGPPPRTYRCRVSGVLAHQRTWRNRITPYVCREDGCSEYGKVRGYGNSTWCEEHGGTQ